MEFKCAIILTASVLLCILTVQGQRPPATCAHTGLTECASMYPSSNLKITNDSTYIFVSTNMCPPYENPHWRNPNQACQMPTTYKIPRYPKDASLPIPLAAKLEVYGNITYLKEYPKPLLGPIGVFTNGVNIFGVGSPCGFSSKCPDQGGPSKYVDAVESEGHTLDQCGGHASPTQQYHIHSGVGIMTNEGRMKCNMSTDVPGQHSALLGWILDGYGLYGQYSLNGEVPTDLDQCGGHSHLLNGVETYHYHLPSPVQFPWTVACMKGCPAITNNPREFNAFTNPPYNCPKN